MNIVSFLNTGFARDYQQAAVDLACDTISSSSKNHKAIHISHDDMLDIEEKLIASQPSLLIIDFGWSSLYGSDHEFLKYVRENKVPVIVVNTSDSDNRLPENIFHVGVRQNTLTRAPISDIMMRVFHAASSGIKASNIQAEINQTISKSDFSTDEFTSKVIENVLHAKSGLNHLPR